MRPKITGQGIKMQKQREPLSPHFFVNVIPSQTPEPDFLIESVPLKKYTFLRDKPSPDPEKVYLSVVTALSGETPEEVLKNANECQAILYAAFKNPHDFSSSHNNYEMGQALTFLRRRAYNPMPIV